MHPARTRKDTASLSGNRVLERIVSYPDPTSVVTIDLMRLYHGRSDRFSSLKFRCTVRVSYSSIYILIPLMISHEERLHFTVAGLDGNGPQERMFHFVMLHRRDRDEFGNLLYPLLPRVIEAAKNRKTALWCNRGLKYVCEKKKMEWIEKYEKRYPLILPDQNIGVTPLKK